MQDQIRSLEHRAEQLAIRFEELADQPDSTKVALAGVFAALGLCWFAIAWGEGLLLLAIPLVFAACWIVLKMKRPHHDPNILEDSRDLGAEGAEIDAWLTRVTTKPVLLDDDLRLLDPEDARAPFASPAPSFEAPLLPPPEEHQESLEELELPSLLPEELIEPEPVPAAVSLYEVCEIRAGTRILLEVRSTFDGAVDVAFELIQERDPPELDIVHVQGDERETAWAYNRDAAADQPRSTLDLFGFDATRWTAARR